MSFSRKALFAVRYRRPGDAAGCGGRRERRHVHRMHRHAAEAGVRPPEQQRRQGDQVRHQGYCDAGRSIEILDERRDQDNFSLDDFEGSIIYNHRFDSAATVTESVQAVLPDADSLAEGADKEEMYHSVGFQVTPDNGPAAPWTNWDDSPVVQFHL